MKRLALLPLLLLASPLLADEIDDHVKAEMARQKISGLTLMITKDDKVVKHEAYGLADQELAVPAKKEMLFESGSIGKTFTAVLIMMLVEQGKLKLDDTLGQHHPNVPEAWKPITLRHLISHTSGLPEYATVEGLYLSQQWSMDTWREKMHKLPMDFKPGASWAYSNTNFVLLGEVAEKAFGKDYFPLVKEKILDPLGMKETHPAENERILPGRARGYWMTPQGAINSPQTNLGRGDGGLIQSVEDLVKFEKGLREGKLIKPESLRTMQEAMKLNNGRKAPYGLGFFVRTVNREPWVSHGGNTGGFAASISRWPSKGLTIALLCNAAQVGGDNLAMSIATKLEPSLAPKKLAEAKDPHPALTEKLLEALLSLAKAEPKKELLDDDFVQRLTTGRGRMSIGPLAQLREVKSLAYLETEPNDPDRIVRYRAKVGDRSFVVAFTVSKDDKVFSAGLRPE